MGSGERMNSNPKVTNSPSVSFPQTGAANPTWKPLGTRWRYRCSRSETGSSDNESWATDGMRGHILLVRDSAMLVANIIAQRSLDAQLYSITRERYERLRSIDRDRELFLRRLQTKGDRFSEMVSRINSAKRPRTADPGTISELNRTSRTPGTEALIHPRSFPADNEDGKTDEAFEVVKTDDQMEIDNEEVSRIGGGAGDIWSYGTQSVNRFRSEHHFRSSSAFPATRENYEANFSARITPSVRVRSEFLPSSTIAQYPTRFTKDKNEIFDPQLRPNSCVFSENSQRPLSSDISDCVRVTKLIDQIDSLHIPPKTKKKSKPKPDSVLREIFRM